MSTAHQKHSANNPRLPKKLCLAIGCQTAAATTFCRRHEKLAATNPEVEAKLVALKAQLKPGGNVRRSWQLMDELQKQIAALEAATLEV